MKRLRLKKQKSRKILLISIGLIVALALVGGAAWYLLRAKSPEDTQTNYDPPTNEQIEAGQNIKENNLKENEAEKPGPTVPAPDAEHVTVAITSAHQTETALQVRAVIHTLSSGECTLTLSRAGGPSVTETAGTQALSSTSTCQGFDVPLSRLSHGQWQLTLTFANNNQAGQTTQEITIE